MADEFKSGCSQAEKIKKFSKSHFSVQFHKRYIVLSSKDMFLHKGVGTTNSQKVYLGFNLHVLEVPDGGWCDCRSVCHHLWYGNTGFYFRVVFL